jgi:hypothetical protein
MVLGIYVFAALSKKDVDGRGRSPATTEKRIIFELLERAEKVSMHFQSGSKMFSLEARCRPS